MTLDLSIKIWYNFIMNKISMTYGILLMLMNNKSLGREELAIHYEVSPRTVQRHIDGLIESGIPIESVPGRGGGYYIPDNYKLPYVLFTKDELTRINACVDALTETFKDNVSRDVKDKLAHLAEGSRLPTAYPPVFVDSDAWNGTSGTMQSKLDIISVAIRESMTVKINYTDKIGNASSRFLDPYTLALKAGVWYVYGWCHTRKEFRLFRLARIKSILIKDTYTKRDGGDVREALSVNLGKIINLHLEFNESCLPAIEEWLGSEAVTVSDEGYSVKACVGDGEDLIKKILSFGSSAKIIAPDYLKMRLKTEAEKISGFYG